MTIAVTDANFATLVSNAKGYVLVDFWAEWCGPCRQLGPIVDEVAKLMSGKVAVYKLNIDDNPESSSQLGIRSIPTLVLFKDGKKADVKIGSMPKTALLDWLESKVNG